jgi:hypothetical protein
MVPASTVFIISDDNGCLVPKSCCSVSRFLFGLSFVDLLFALIVALRRYKQMAVSQKCGDIFLPPPRNQCHTPAHGKFGDWPHARMRDFTFSFGKPSLVRSTVSS